MKNLILLGSALCILILMNSFVEKHNDLKDVPPPFDKTFSFISPGQVIINEAPEEFKGFTIEGTSETIKADVSEFYISKYEVSNQEYATFLKEYRRSAGMNDWETVMIDTSKWVNYVTYAAPFVENYHSHEAYSSYPVVNVSYEGATAYCNWLTEKVNAQMHDGSVTFRLPTKEEWVRAARSDDHEFTYAWGIEDAIDENGAQRCNFNKDRSPYSKISALGNSNTKKPVVVVGTLNRLKSSVKVTSPVSSYQPSKNDLYNMNGNVAEMISEKFVAMGGCWDSSSNEVKIESEMSYIAPSPHIGFRPVMVIN